MFSSRAGVIGLLTQYRRFPDKKQALTCIKSIIPCPCQSILSHSCSYTYSARPASLREYVEYYGEHRAHLALTELFEDLVVGYRLACHFTLQQDSSVVGKTKGADLDSGPIIAGCQPAVQDHLLEHQADADVSRFRGIESVALERRIPKRVTNGVGSRAGLEPLVEHKTPPVTRRRFLDCYSRTR